ncbi:hypothetical protein D2T29_12575 [Sinirhodobacter populi]|uniref:Uncharacterized protein n=1 Tax=Paenirhodobacter populi TaxID=2306993 RepID=A0A443KCE2_9RHOB|nr:hypothetical protein [Sinirhodobacter populi]RWR30499.1 hypothetical protein D2T29_12575 [Sinirhodobacter populi]
MFQDEDELKQTWTKQGVQPELQDRLMRRIKLHARPGAQVGPFVIGDQPTRRASTVLKDWRSYGGKSEENATSAVVSVNDYQIQVKLADGRAVWLEMEGDLVRVHAQCADHETDVSVEIGRDGLRLYSDATRPALATMIPALSNIAGSAS